jgi:hypothetical protein
MLFGVATTYYSFKCKGLPGIAYSLFALAALVVWSITGTFLSSFFSFGENRYGFAIFFVWHLATFFPWILLCRNKYKISEPWFPWIGLSGILTQVSFLTGIFLFAFQDGLSDIDNIFRYCALLLLAVSLGLACTAVTMSFKRGNKQRSEMSLLCGIWGSVLLFGGIAIWTLAFAARGV